MKKQRAQGLCAVVCHDAGGAEILSSYVRRVGLQCIFVLDGPARLIFRRKCEVRTILPLNQAIKRSNWVLTGTSWNSELEFDALRVCRAHDKYCVTFLDHWVNYWDRFERRGKVYLPDEIWVGDLHALTIAQGTFPGVSIKFIENPYFQEIRREASQRRIEKFNKKNSLNVLYVCEPIKNHARVLYGSENHWGYTEDDALRYFLNYVSIKNSSLREIVIRPHPSELVEKYAWALSEYDLPIRYGGESPLIDEVLSSDVVVGCNSMAMIVGLLAGKIVISSIPPSGSPCVLPYKEIIPLKDDSKEIGLLIHNARA